MKRKGRKSTPIQNRVPWKSKPPYTNENKSCYSTSSLINDSNLFFFFFFFSMVRRRRGPFKHIKFGTNIELSDERK